MLPIGERELRVKRKIKKNANTSQIQKAQVLELNSMTSCIYVYFFSTIFNLFNVWDN